MIRFWRIETEREKLYAAVRSWFSPELLKTIDKEQQTAVEPRILAGLFKD